MTREEAVARIKDHIEIHKYHERNAVKISEALDMAIKALEQPEPCRDTVSRAAAIDAFWKLDVEMRPTAIDEVVKMLRELPSTQPSFLRDHENDHSAEVGKKVEQLEQRWIPVTLETLPNPSSVVVVCGKKGTWDYGTYRGWYGDIHSWQWKNNTIKHVYWWMYKTDALPEPYREEGEKR